MNYIYGSILSFQKLYNYMIYTPNLSYLSNNYQLIKRNDIRVSLYLQYKYFFSEGTMIEDNLFLGSSYNAHNISYLNKKKINVILNICDKYDKLENQDTNLIYYQFPIQNECYNIKNILNDSYKVIQHHQSLGDKILVYCNIEGTKSALVIIYYIMKKYGLSYPQTLTLLKLKRPIINLTEYFHNILNKIDCVYIDDREYLIL